METFPITCVVRFQYFDKSISDLMTKIIKMPILCYPQDAAELWRKVEDWAFSHDNVEDFFIISFDFFDLHK